METNFVLEDHETMLQLSFCDTNWRFWTDIKLPCIKYTVYSPHLSWTLLLLLEHFILLHSNLVSSSWLLFSYSCHFFSLRLSSSSQQKHFSSALLSTSHNVTIYKNWSLTFVRFLVCFLLLLLLLFSLIFSNVKHFFLVNLKSFFTFNIFLLFFSTDIFTFIFLHPQAFTKIQRSIHYNLTYSTTKLIQQTVKPKLGQRQVFFNKTSRWVSSLSLWRWRAMTVRFRRNAHKKSCSFKDDWNPLKLTLDVTMLQKAKLTLVTSLKQLNHDNYFTMLRRSLAVST